MKAGLDVADIFRAYGEVYQARYGDHMPLRQKRAMRAIQLCRTAALGGHIDKCEDCGAERNSYNSCRNRHCPKCQFLTTERWIEARREDLLPIPYFHVVFTLPEQLRSIALRNQRVVYGLLFKAASQTLLELARDPKYLGAEIGFTAVLHTWSQTLIDHPHLHCIVTGGGLSLDGQQWKSARTQFFLPVKVLSRVFRGKFLHYLKHSYAQGRLRFPGQIEPLEDQLLRLIRLLYETDWRVYCKPPFADAEDVVAYVGRYTHRIAISNQRLVSLQNDQVCFRYQDREHGNCTKTMVLDTFEFIRRFLLHVLPGGFVKIRHYGLLSNRTRHKKIACCRRLLGDMSSAGSERTKASWQELLFRLTGVDVQVCLSCGGRMSPVETIAPQRAPPATLAPVA